LELCHNRSAENHEKAFESGDLEKPENERTILK
jgi:hypothetical protein